MFSNSDIADYYNQTLNHYARWWKLNQSQSVHYGYWKENTKNFTEALLQTNIEMATLAEIKPHELILDAGCGVGGSSFFLAKVKQCKVEGITLSKKQLAFAEQILAMQPTLNIHFSIMDFNHTTFPDNHFDVVWACESSCYANPKTDFISEVKRILKPGGRLVVADYFTNPVPDQRNYLRKWADLWAIDHLHSESNFIQPLSANGFHILHNTIVTPHIKPSARKMYWASILGAIPSELYNLFNRTSRFGKNHYRSGYYQYKALQANLWDYRMVVAVKN